MLEIYQMIHSQELGVIRNLQRLCVDLIELNLGSIMLHSPLSEVFILAIGIKQHLDLLYITHFPSYKIQDSLTSNYSYDEFILM